MTRTSEDHTCRGIEIIIDAGEVSITTDEVLLGSAAADDPVVRLSDLQLLVDGLDRMGRE